MTLDEARKILGSQIGESGDLNESVPHLFYGNGDETACLDGDFSADDLEAIAVFMRASQAAKISEKTP